MRALQRFSDEYLEQSRRLRPLEIVRFLEDFRLLHGSSARSVLISVKVPEPLLRAFRRRCDLRGVRYQTTIKRLMLDWLEGEARRKRAT